MPGAILFEDFINVIAIDVPTCELPSAFRLLEEGNETLVRDSEDVCAALLSLYTDEDEPLVSLFARRIKVGVYPTKENVTPPTFGELLLIRGCFEAMFEANEADRLDMQRHSRISPVSSVIESHTLRPSPRQRSRPLRRREGLRTRSVLADPVQTRLPPAAEATELPREGLGSAR